MGAQLDLDDLVADWPEAKAELARLRAERDELRTALEEIEGMYASAIQTGNYYLAVEYCFNIAHAAISRMESEEL